MLPDFCCSMASPKPAMVGKTVTFISIDCRQMERSSFIDFMGRLTALKTIPSTRGLGHTRSRRLSNDSSEPMSVLLDQHLTAGGAFLFGERLKRCATPRCDD